MDFINKQFLINSDIQTIFTDTWKTIRPHMVYLSLIWAVFYIPTQAFVLLRSGEMIRHLDSGSTMVIPVLILLNLLGTIPNIVIVLLMREKDCDDYNYLVMESFKKLPLYITTTLVMIFRMIPLIFLALVLSLLLSTAMLSAGIPEMTQLFILIPMIIVIIFWALLQYSSSVNFYLLRDLPNFKGTYYSRLLFSQNRKKVMIIFGISNFLPMSINLLMLYFVQNDVIHIMAGFILGYYLFLSSAFFAGIFNHIDEDPQHEDAENGIAIE